MMTALPNARYERKLVASGFTTEEVLSMVRRHPAGFRQAYPERVINNIYLDSPALGGYHEHVNGSANRVKVRVRWYGPSAAGPIEKPVLEEKLKRGAMSGKLAHALPPLVLNGEPLQVPLAAAFGGTALPDIVRANLRHLEPSLFNRYCRRYFVRADGSFRLTVDTDLHFARLRKSSRPPTSLLDGWSFPIIELKYLSAYAERAEAITNVFPCRVARCSKYVLGIERVAGL